MITFRIRKVGRSWRIESWETAAPYGPGWAPVCTGFQDVDEARRFLLTATVEWDADRLGGRYTFA